MKIKTKKFGKVAVSSVLAATLLASAGATAISSISAFAAEANAGTSNRFVSQYDSLNELYDAEAKLNVDVATEGMVLLKNKDNALPLSRRANVTLLGADSYNLYQGRNGTPGNGYAKVELTDSLESVGITVNPRVQGIYKGGVAGKHLMSTAASGGVEFDGKHYVPAANGMLDDAINNLKFYDDAAIISLRREGEEGADNLAYNVPGHSDKTDHNLMLTDVEKETFAFAKAHFKKIIVLLNIPSTMEIGALEDDDAISAIVHISLPGVNGASAIGKLLTGEANFSGRTIEFFMRDFKEDPTWYNFASYGQAYNTINGGDSFTDPAGIIRNGQAPAMQRAVTEAYKGSEVALDYAEGIYFGYRYYETVAEDLGGEKGEKWYQEHTIYPFGYGLSYTSFKQEITGVNGNLNSKNGKVTVEVKVTNTGAVAGKEVVQLYSSAPYTKGGIDKAAVNLVGFTKTNELKPGKSQTVEVTFDVKDLASFDYNDANENEHYGYELEKGNYVLSIRSDSHTVLDSEKLDCSATLNWDEDNDDSTPNNIFSQEDGEWEQYNTLAHHWTKEGTDHYLTRDKLVENGEVYDLKELAWLIDEEENMFTHEAFNVLKNRLASHAYEDYDNALTDAVENDYKNVWAKEMKDIPDTWTQATGVKGENGRYAIELYDMLGVDYNDAKWDTFLNQLTLDEMINFVLDGGYHNQSIDSIGKPYVEDTDGPSQMGKGWAWCGAPLIAQTYNVDLSYEVGEAIGNETMLLGRKGWYGPGMNLHRSPLAGRNFEYYSQDALQGGLIGAAVVQGVVDMGGHVFVKHTFGNEQETSRQGVVTFMTEQTLREVYAKPFEIVVKKGHANGLMTSFNLIGLQSSVSYAINQQMYINEWGYDGFSVTDFWVDGNPMCGWPMGELVRGGILPLNAMGSIGHNDYSDVGLEYSWDNTQRGGKGMLMVPTYDAETKTINKNQKEASATSYYWLRDMVKHILYITANSHYMNNGYADYMLKVDSGLSLKVGDPVANKNILTAESLTSLDKVFGSSGYTLTATGLPEGLAMNATGVLSGSPAEAGSFEVTLRIVGNYGLSYITGSDKTQLTVAAAQPKAIDKVTITGGDATFGQSYTGNIDGAPLEISEDNWASEPTMGGFGPEYKAADLGKYASMTYTVTGLPKGLSVNGEGEITGTPTEAGDFIVNVTIAYEKVVIAFSNGQITVYGTEKAESFTGQYKITVTGGYNVTFNTNGGAFVTVVVDETPWGNFTQEFKEYKVNIGIADSASATTTFGTIKNKIGTPTNGSYKFLGWATKADAKTPDVTDETMLDKTTVLYAVWGDPDIMIKNGTWWVNGQDTGISATGTNGKDGQDGVNGQDGVTPAIEISEDGYWVINGIISDVKAVGEPGAPGNNGSNGTNGANGTNGTNSGSVFGIVGGVLGIVALAGAGVCVFLMLRKKEQK